MYNHIEMNSDDKQSFLDIEAKTFFSSRKNVILTKDFTAGEKLLCK